MYGTEPARQVKKIIKLEFNEKWEISKMYSFGKDNLKETPTKPCFCLFFMILRHGKCLCGIRLEDIFTL